MFYAWCDTCNGTVDAVERHEDPVTMDVVLVARCHGDRDHKVFSHYDLIRESLMSLTKVVRFFPPTFRLFDEPNRSFPVPVV